jgi:pyruvate/2-oxoglutarate dehydrogenase complex dihydrolipoamide acyltransferase (E2) component
MDNVVTVSGPFDPSPTVQHCDLGDHRLHDGEELSAFTADVVTLIENPVRLLGALR